MIAVLQGRNRQLIYYIIYGLHAARWLCLRILYSRRHWCCAVRVQAVQAETLIKKNVHFFTDNVHSMYNKLFNINSVFKD